MPLILCLENIILAVHAISKDVLCLSRRRSWTEVFRRKNGLY